MAKLLLKFPFSGAGCDFGVVVAVAMFDSCVPLFVFIYSQTRILHKIITIKMLEGSFRLFNFFSICQQCNKI